MAFRIDDDENRIQDLKDQIDQLEIQTFSPEVVARNESTRNTGIASGDAAATNAYPQWLPIRDFEDVGLVSQEIVLNRVDSHIAKMRIVGDVDFAFSEPPPANKMMWFILDVTIDGTGGYIINLPGNVIPASTTIDNTADARTVIRFTTTDGGTTFFAENLETGGTGNVPDGTAQFQHLEWDGAAWIAQQALAFGGVSADAGQIRLPNNTIGVAWRNAANGGNIEIKVNASDFVDITNSANDTVGLSLRAQDATNSDAAMSITQTSDIGAGVSTTTFTYPNEFAINRGATLVALFDSTNEINFFGNVDINDNDIVKIKDLDFDDLISTIRGLVINDWFQAGHEHASVSGEFNYRVDTNDDHNFFTGAEKIVTISNGALNVNNNVINTIKELQFDISNTFIPVTVGIGFTSTGVMIHTLPFATDFYDFRINGESLFTISRFGTNQGQIVTSIITATDFFLAEQVLDFATFDNTSPTNGNVWLNTSGDFQFRENGVTIGLGGGGAFLPLTGGTMSGAINMGNNDLTSVDDITFTGSSSVINLNGGDMTGFDTIQASGSSSEINMLGGFIDMDDGEIRDADDITLHGNSRILSVGSTEFGIQIDNASANVGTAGMMAIPVTDIVTVVTVPLLDGAFGTHKGAMGLDFNNLTNSRLWVRENSTVGIGGAWLAFDYATRLEQT